MATSAYDLCGAALDVEVARLAGVSISMWGETPVIEGGPGMAGSNVTSWAPSRDWGQGGPIKTSERIATWWDGECWRAAHKGMTGAGGFYPCSSSRSAGTVIDMGYGDGMPGSTELEAAMRAYVKAKRKGCGGEVLQDA